MINEDLKDQGIFDGLFADASRGEFQYERPLAPDAYLGDMNMEKKVEIDPGRPTPQMDDVKKPEVKAINDPSVAEKESSRQLKGVGTDTDIVPAEEGCEGLQSPTFYRFDLMDPVALFALGEVLHEGAEKYGENNWRKIPCKNHLNKALIHIYAYLMGNVDEDHLGHAFTRLMMAIGTQKVQ